MELRGLNQNNKNEFLKHTFRHGASAESKEYQFEDIDITELNNRYRVQGPEYISYEK